MSIFALVIIAILTAYLLGVSQALTYGRRIMDELADEIEQEQR